MKIVVAYCGYFDSSAAADTLMQVVVNNGTPIERLFRTCGYLGHLEDTF
jgi:predicted PP-loop superfamily ATPase